MKQHPSWPLLHVVSPRQRIGAGLACTLTLMVGLVWQGTASAQNIKVYQYTQANGVIAFSDRPPLNRPYKLMKYNCFACDVRSKVDWSNTKLFLHAHKDTIDQAASKHRLDPALIRALIHAESGFSVRARSPKGAQGLMQLMPGTAAELGVQDPYEARSNIMGGVKHLARLQKALNGDTRLMMAAYNAGLGAVKKHQGIPPYAETQAYVERVHILWQRYKAAEQRQNLASNT